MSKQDGPRCTVGDDFTGIKKIIHDVTMNNELYNGYGAYRVSYADTGDPKNKSGISFGANQMDMSTNSNAIGIFIDIMENAKDSSGNLLIKPSVVLDIRGGEKNYNLKATLKTPEQVFGKNLPLVNAALSSEYRIKTINEAYLNALNHDMAHIDKAINLMQNPAAKTFYNTDAGKTLLYDYHNQYGLTLKGDEAKFINDYINGDYNGTKRYDYYSKEKYAAPTDHYGYEDHVNFLHTTDQYRQTPIMVDKRIEKTFTLLEKYGLNEISVGKNTTVEPFECYFGDKYVPLDGDLWIQTTGTYYDPIMTNIIMQSIEDTGPQLGFLNLDSSYYPASNMNNLSYEITTTPLNNTFFEPYVPSYNLIDFSTPSTYIEPYNFSLDNYNSNINYFDITNYQIPVDSNFGLGNYNWGGGGYFGGGYGGGSNYFGNNYSFSMHSKKNTLENKTCVLNQIIDLETAADNSLNFILESPTINITNDSSREYWNTEFIAQDPLRDFFEIVTLTA